MTSAVNTVWVSGETGVDGKPGALCGCSDEAPVDVERTIYVDASLSRVWQAIVEPCDFSQWFGARLDRPFRVSEYSHGHSIYPACEGLRWRAMTETMDHERLLRFTWWPAPQDEPFDESGAPGTQVEITVRATVDGTRVIFRESGFERIADGMAREALIEVRAAGWREQASNLRKYVDRT